ncbi:MAG TPA: hypothetical protein ENN03_03935 [bacterium]|nr:hypothetical protein [bacterium]
MESSMNLKQLEKETYLRYHRDGIIDILMGLFSLGIGWLFASHEYTPSIIIWMVILFYKPMKEKITAPRMGRVQFHPNRQHRIKLGTGTIALGLTVLLVAGTGLFLAFKQLPVFLLEHAPYLIVITAAVLLAVNGVLHGIRRWIVYSVLVIVTGALSLLFSCPVFWVFLIFGGTATIAGLIYLAIFIRNHPRTPESQNG